MYAKAHRRDQKRLKDELLRLHEEIEEVKKSIKLHQRIEKMQPKFKKNDVATNKTEDNFLPIGSLLLKCSERDAHCYVDQEGFLREEFIWAFCGYPFHISMRTVDCVKIGTL